MARRFPEEIEVELGLDEPDDHDALRARVAARLDIAPGDLPLLELLKRSIDARGGRVRFRLLVGIGTVTDHGELGGDRPRHVSLPARVIVVGDGPAGLFCAYQLARHGVAATVLDRGKRVIPRRVDLRGLNQRGAVDEDSNYCFGEGGAGTYSDGKLYTRAHKRGNVRDVIELLALHGAPEAILTDARPHIGSNRLPKVITAMRERLEAVGVEFRFGARVVELLVDERRGRRHIAGVRLADGTELAAEIVVLATGHSARDVLIMLERAGVRLEAKPFALGVRIEHPQPLINAIQYGRDAGHARLPNAPYRVATTVEDRGVFSFCMCPGGWIVPASTEPGALVVNGMSLAKRNSPYANSGFVVAVELADLEAAGYRGPLAGIELQAAIERAAFVAGGGSLRAPATRVTDFLARRASSTVPSTSYIPGLTATDVGAVVDAAGLRIAERLRVALRRFDRQLRGYASEEAVLVGVESRTSSPVRVPRDPSSVESQDLAGLYPAGEGAGFAGGIVSAALDGMRVADAVAARLGARPR
ncbi:MAG: FAD-dependent oxidoreductase [Deltaproteobacteria bacterium]|nr:FAD-dependent oxidoreductase [Deltaproteobacteria bacterium]